MRTWAAFKNELARRYFTRLLIQTNCNVAEAARRAEMNRTDLYKKLKLHGISHLEIAKDLLEHGKPEVINRIRRKLNRKFAKPNWDAELPGYTPYEPKPRNNNVRT